MAHNMLSLHTSTTKYAWPWSRQVKIDWDITCRQHLSDVSIQMITISAINNTDITQNSKEPARDTSNQYHSIYSAGGSLLTYFKY